MTRIRTYMPVFAWRGTSGLESDPIIPPDPFEPPALYQVQPPTGSTFSVAGSPAEFLPIGSEFELQTFIE